MIRTSSQGGCFRTGSFRLLLAGAALAVLACAGPEARGGAAGQEGSRIRPGTAFPAMTVQAVRKGASEPSPLDLSGDLGSRPILFFYLNPGHAISEQVLAEVSSFLAAETPGKIALHLVVMPDRAPAPVELRERLAGLGVEAPVILDEGRRIAEALGVTVVPSMALVDRDGILRFGGASSLEQNVLREITLGEAIRMAARGEEPPTVARLQRYYTVSDVVGERFRDFQLPEYRSGGKVRLSDLVGPGKVTGVFYWSPSDPFSQRAMPGIVAGYRTYSPRLLNLISVVRDGTSDEIEAYAGQWQVTFPILENRDKAFSDLYRVQSTPTLILIGPDGIIDSVYTSGNINYFTVLQKRIHVLVLEPRAGV